MPFTEHIRELIQAGFSGIWVETWEADEAGKEIYKLAQDNNWEASGWDIERGEYTTGACKGDPIGALDLAKRNGSPKIICLMNYHHFLKNPMVSQKLANKIVDGKGDQCFYVVLSPLTDIPIEVQKLITVVEHDLPDRAAITQIATDLRDSNDLQYERDSNAQAAVTAATGLTRYEAENAFALSMARHNCIVPPVVWELKAQMLKKSGLMTLHQGDETFDHLGGLEQLKSFTIKALAHTTITPTAGRPRARGVLLLGVPGTGKSAFAKALGNEVGRPTLTLDIGALYGSLVGETEAKVRQALKVADAMAPCVLFIDEIEKALSGNGSQGDSGVSTRLFGTFLTWLNDHTSDVFVIATSNDVSQLPPEFSRAERWDGVFFIDLPEALEQSSIWQLYLEAYGLKPKDYSTDHDIIVIPPCDGWTGAEIKACCRLSALLDIPLSEAATYVVPVSTTAPEKVFALRQWASGKALSASSPGIYQSNPRVVNKSRRKVQEASK